ncbi:hypothetical protein BJ508DRAFT_306534 [Ascobolus immersus RN42]|uniref:Uncharacterized protein n=1 Tax=Ascobolus immersus RN42 TaxID=1160509 RepID=A0A3N4I9Y7_ASCIM|nr:hypothetical protein BJ508DRAFT_306534 [Ascobolus immersus RN42]
MVSAARRQKIARAKARAKAEAAALAEGGQVDQQPVADVVIPSKQVPTTPIAVVRLPKTTVISTIPIPSPKPTTQTTPPRLTISTKPSSPPKPPSTPTKPASRAANLSPKSPNSPKTNGKAPRLKKPVNQTSPVGKLDFNKRPDLKKTDSKRSEVKKQDLRKVEPKKAEPKKQDSPSPKAEKKREAKKELYDPKAENIEAVNFGEPFKKEKEPRVYLTKGCALPASWSYAVLFGKRRDLKTLVLEDYDKPKLIYAWPVHLSSFTRPHSPYHRAWGPFSRFAHDQCEIATKEIFDKYCPADPNLPNDWAALKREQSVISGTMEILNQLKQIFDIAKEWAKYEGVIGAFNDFVTGMLDAMEDLGTFFFSDNQSVFDIVKEARLCIQAMAKVAFAAAQEGRIIKEEPRPKKKQMRRGKEVVGDAASGEGEAASGESGSESGDESVEALE